MIGAIEAEWLGFLEAFRTFWLAPPPEIRVIMREAGVPAGASA